MGTMNARFKLTLFLLTALVLLDVAVIHAADYEPRLIQIEVTKQDSLGRVQVMEVRSGAGTCIAEATYDGGPRVYVVAITQDGIRNLGFAAISGETAKDLNNEILMGIFETTIREHCLPLIVPGYIKT